MFIRIDCIMFLDFDGLQGLMGFDGDDEGGLGIVIKIWVWIKKLSMYCVLILNDDYMLMEFVVLILECFFVKSCEQVI